MSSNSLYNTSNELPSKRLIQLPPHLTQTPAPLALSPHTIQTTLQTQPDLNTMLLRAIANGLLQTIANRKANTAITAKEYKDQVHSLEQCILHYKDTFNQPLEGFVLNNGQVSNFHIPIGNRLYQEAKWIHLNENGTISRYTSTRAPTSSATLLIFMLPPTIALTCPSTPYSHGSVTCSPVQGATFTSSRPQWPTLMIGAWREKSCATRRLTTTLPHWQLSSRSTSMTLTLRRPALCHVSPISCSPTPQNMSSHSAMWLGRQVQYVQGGKELIAGYRAPMSTDVHCREGVMTLALGQH
jgi:hypothetical protein